jgi:hypothetical protein
VAQRQRVAISQVISPFDLANGAPLWRVGNVSLAPTLYVGATVYKDGMSRAELRQTGSSAHVVSQLSTRIGSVPVCFSRRRRAMGYFQFHSPNYRQKYSAQWLSERPQ